MDQSSSNVVIGSASLVAGSRVQSFGAQTGFAAYAQLGNVVTADLNGDGYQDVVFPDGQGNIDVLMGKGDGTFTGPNITSTSASPSAVAVGDVNADGIPDIVSVGSAGVIDIFLGNGDGSFTLRRSLPGLANGLAVVLGDFNGDGNLDIAATTGSNQILILFGSGDGQFSTQGAANLDFSASSFTAADLNGDGVLDLVATNPSGNTVAVLLGKGDGTFQAGNSFQVAAQGAIAKAVVTGDFDGDGKLDLATVNSNGTASTLRGLGNGTFATAVTYSVGTSPLGLAVADFNQDGYPDLVVADPSASLAYLLTGKGDGTFNAATSFAVAANSSSVAAADFDGNGVPDLAFTAATNHKASVVLNNLTSSSTATATGVNTVGSGGHVVYASYPGSTSYLASTSPTTTITAQRITPTLTLAITAGGSAVTSTTRDTLLTFTATLTQNGAYSPSGTVNFCDATALSCTDVHLLGTAQLTTSGTASIKLRLAPGAKSLKALFLGNVNVAKVSSANVALSVGGAVSSHTLSKSGDTGNYTLTAAITSQSSRSTPTGTVSFIDQTAGNSVLATATLQPQSTTVGRITATRTDTLPGKKPTAELVCDFNGDGYLDYVAYSSIVADGVIVYLGNGDGTFQTPITTGSSMINVMVAADINGDGKLDLVASYAGTKTLGVLLGNGDGTFTAGTTIALTADAGGIAVGDFNRDGFLDIAVTNSSANAIYVYTNKGDGTFNAGVRYATGQIPSVLAAVDMNGDGILDLVACNDSGVSIHLGNGDGTFAAPYNGVAVAGEYRMAIADLNGDGKPDIVTASDGNVFTFYGNGDGTTQQYTGPPQSGQETGIALGDVDGNGQTDIIIATYPGSLRVDTNDSGVFSFNSNYSYASSGYITSVVAADFRGIGLADILVNSSIGSTITYMTSSYPTGAIATATGVAPAAAGTATHVISSSYSGDSVFGANVSAATVSLTAQPVATTLTLSVASSSTFANHSVTLTATLSPNANSGHSSNGETIAFYNGSTSLGSATLSGGVATLTTAALPAGNNSLTAKYTSDGYLADATSSAVALALQSQTASATTISVAGLDSSSNATLGTVLTVTVTVKQGSSPVTAGTVLLCDGSATNCTNDHLLGTLQLTSAGTAVMKYRPAVGTNSIKARFVGTASLSPSTATSSSFTVKNVPTITTISASGSAGSYTLSSTVTGSGSVTAPAGTVEFLDTSNSNAQLATATLSGGTLTQALALQSGVAATGAQPIVLAKGDFNGDGIMDVVTANFGGQSLNVVLGGASGTFGSLPTIAVGNNPRSVVVGDFNGDGKLDIAVAVASDQVIKILLGNGDGTFQAPVSAISAGVLPQTLVVGDFNQDGNLDLAFTSYYGGSVTVYQGNGDGTFGGAHAYAVGGNPLGAMAADLNGDGVPDLVVLNTGSNDMSVLLNNGDGTFGAATFYTTGTNPQSVAAVDVSNSGYPALAVTNSGSNTVSVFKNNGNGTFATPSSYAVGAGPQGIGAADLDRDGYADLVVTNTSDNSVSVLMGNSSGGFTTPATTIAMPAGTSPAGLVLTDANGDGLPDVIVAGYGTNVVNVLLDQVSVSATATASNVAVYGTGTHATKAQYDGSSVYAVSTSATTSLTGVAATTTLGLAANPTASVVGQSVTLTATLSPYQSGGSSSNGETVTFYNGSTSLGTGMLQAGVATLTTASLPMGTNLLKVTYAGDTYRTSAASANVSFTVATIPSTSVALSVTVGGSVPTSINVGTAVTLKATVTNPSAVTHGTVRFCNAKYTDCSDIHSYGTAQLKADGAATLKVLPQAPSLTVVAKFLGTTNNLASASAASAVYPVVNAKTGTSFTQQGTPDNLTFNITTVGYGEDNSQSLSGSVAFTDTSDSNRALGTAALSGSTHAQALNTISQTPTLTGTNPIYTVTGDFNGDGRPDVAVAYYNSGSVSILLSNGDGTFTQSTLLGFTNARTLAVGDFNGDGNLDLVVVNAGSNSVSVLLGKGDGTFNAAVNYPSSTLPQTVVVGDFNHDGNLDLAVTSFADNNVSVYFGNGDGTFGTRATYATGTNTISAVVVDLDGDGMPDLAVTNQGDNTISTLINRGDGTFLPKVTYNVGAQPVSIAAGDLDGDGYPDLVVANSGARSVSVLQNNGNGTLKAAVSYAVGTTPMAVAVANMTGNSKADVLVVNQGDNSLTLLANSSNGSLSLATKASYVMAGGPRSLAVADFDGDGVADVAVLRYDANAMTVYLNSLSVTGTATLTGVDLVGSGYHFVTGTYTDAASFGPSTAGPVAIQGHAKATTLTLTADTGSSVYGTSVTLTASVSPNNLTSHSPDGILVTFYNGTATLGSSSIANGVATFSTTSLPAGSASLTAVFNGDLYYGSSTSNTLAHVIAQAASSATWSPSASQVYTGTMIGSLLTAQGSVPGTFVYTATLQPAGSTVSVDASTVLGTGQYVLTATLTPSSANYASSMVTAPLTVQAMNLFVVSGAGSLTSLYNNGNVQQAGTSGGGIGAAVDASGGVWSINTSGNSLTRFTTTGTVSLTATGGGLTGATALATDGGGIVWVANGNGTLSAFSTTGTAVSATPVAPAAGISTPASLSVDAAGSLWIADTANDSVVEVIGAATPVSTPIVKSVINNAPAARP